MYIEFYKGHIIMEEGGDYIVRKYDKETHEASIINFCGNLKKAKQFIGGICCMSGYKQGNFIIIRYPEERAYYAIDTRLSFGQQHGYFANDEAELTRKINEGDKLQALCIYVANEFIIVPTSCSYELLYAVEQNGEFVNIVSVPTLDDALYYAEN